MSGATVDHNNPNTEDIEYDGTVGGDNARHPLETEAAPPEIEADDAILFELGDNKADPEADAQKTDCLKNSAGNASAFVKGNEKGVKAPEQTDDGFGVDDGASLALDMLPFVGTGKSIGQLFTGKDLVTGEPVNRGMEFLSIFAGIVPGGKGVMKGIVAGAATVLGPALKKSGVVLGNAVKAAKNKIKDFKSFKTHGLNVDPTSIAEGRALMKELKKANPDMSLRDVKDLAGGMLNSGKNIPIVRNVKPNEILYKIVPKGSEVTSYTPYFVSEKQLNALKGNPQTITETMALPKVSKAEQYDIYQIKPKTGKTPKTFESEVANTSEGLIKRKGGGDQIIVPNRPDWTKAEKIGEI